jgi:hypothetical protein
VGTSHVLVWRCLPVKASRGLRTLFDVKPGDLLVRAGAIVFAVGALAVLAILVPFFLGDGHDAPTALNLVALLLPLGLGLALAGLLRGSRSQ